MIQLQKMDSRNQLNKVINKRVRATGTVSHIGYNKDHSQIRVAIEDVTFNGDNDTFTDHIWVALENSPKARHFFFDNKKEEVTFTGTVKPYTRQNKSKSLTLNQNRNFLSLKDYQAIKQLDKKVLKNHKKEVFIDTTKVLSEIKVKELVD